MTRRWFLALCAAGMRRLAAAPTASQPLSNGRAYRVDATIVFLSLPLFTRTNVGSGYARHIESQDSKARTHLLEFAAGSLPERAHGLNRLGMIRETVVEAGPILDASYFGFMTASREESFGEAKKALDQSPARCLFVAIEGDSSPEEVRSRHAEFTSDVRPDSAQWKRLQSDAKAAFRTPKAEHSSRPPEGGAAPPTFLFAVLQALRTGGKLRQQYVYGRDRFELLTTNKPDPATGRRLRAKGIASDPAKVSQLSGTIRNLRTGKRTVFRIWSERDAAPVPLRIEYQPRGFLVLALEADPAGVRNWPL